MYKVVLEKDNMRFRVEGIEANTPESAAGKALKVLQTLLRGEIECVTTPKVVIEDMRYWGGHPRHLWWAGVFHRDGSSYTVCETDNYGGEFVLLPAEDDDSEV